MFLFLLFSRLKHEYTTEQIVKTSLTGTILAGSIIALILRFTGFKFELFIVFLAIIAAARGENRKYNWNYWLTLEKITVPGLVSLSIYWLANLFFSLRPET